MYILNSHHVVFSYRKLTLRLTVFI